MLLDVFAVDEVVFLPPLSSLVVDEVVFAELAEVMSVLPGVLPAPEVGETAGAEEATEEPEPEPEPEEEDA